MIKKFFSPFCIFISLLLLCYIFYKSEIAWQGTRRDYYFFYYIASVSILLFSIITIFLSQKTKTYLIIIFLSLAFSFYLFEAYLIINDSTLRKAKIYKKKTGNIYDKRSKLEIYNDLKKNDKEISVTIFPFKHLNKSNSNFIPLSGKSNSKTIFCNENGYYAIYKSDRYGFNNPDEEWDKTVIEYLLVGDSFVHGACVNRPNDISSKLRNISNKSVISLGYGSNGPILEYASLREFFPNRVKNVLWFYYEGNDVKNLSDELRNIFLRKYIKNINFSQNLKKKQSLVDNLSEKIINLERKEAAKKAKISSDLKYKIYSYLKLNKLRSNLNILLPSKRRPPTQNKIKPEFKEILKLAKELTEKKGSNFYFIYLPTYKRYKKIDNNDVNYNKVKSVMNELKIPFIDIHKVFDKEKNPIKLFPFEMYGHYTVEGNEIIAQEVFEFINKNKFN